MLAPSYQRFGAGSTVSTDLDGPVPSQTNPGSQTSSGTTPRDASEAEEPEEDTSEIIELAESLVSDIRAAAKESQSTLDTAISITQSIIMEGRPFSFSDMMLHLRMLVARFLCSGIAMDLEDGIMLFIQHSPTTAMDEHASSDDIRFAGDLHSEFLESIDPSNVDNAIFLYRHAKELQSAHTPVSHQLPLALADVLTLRFILLLDTTSLAEGIALQKELIDSWSGPSQSPERHRPILSLTLNLLFQALSRAGTSSLLGSNSGVLSLFQTYNRENAALFQMTQARLSHIGNDLHDVPTKHHQWFLDIYPHNHPRRRLALSMLANFYMTRFVNSNFVELSDWEMALGLSRETVAIVPKNSDVRLHALNLQHEIMALVSSQEISSDIETFMSEHIEIIQELLDHSHWSPREREKLLESLARAFAFRSISKIPTPMYEIRDGRFLDDLNKAISAFNKARRILEDFPSHFEPRDGAGILTHTSGLYGLRFSATRTITDLDMCITLTREALERSSSDALSAVIRPQLASSLRGRFMLLRVTRDVNEAIMLLQEATARGAASPMAPEMLLETLGSLFELRYRHLRDPGDLDRSIDTMKEVLSIRRKNASSSVHFTEFDLTHLLLTRYRTRLNPTDLRDALRLTDVLDAYVENLYRRLRFSCYNGEDIAASIQACTALLDIHDVTLDRDFLHSARKLARDIAAHSTDAGLAPQLETALMWAKASEYGSQEALKAYSQAIKIMPQVASVELDSQSRQDLLRITPGLASGAADCAVYIGQPEKAVEFLSAGRGGFWAQSLNLRDPLDDLRTAAPGLAEKLRTTSLTLEETSLHELPGLQVFAGSASLRRMETDHVERRQRKETWNQLVQEIRSTVPGFEDFMLPKSFDKLRKCASNGPVILLVASKPNVLLNLAQHRLGELPQQDRAIPFALIITAEGGVRCLRLPNTSYVELEELGFRILETTGTRGRGRGVQVANNEAALSAISYRLKARRTAGVKDKPLEGDLRLLWTSVVKPIVQHLQLQLSNTPQRIWWCPTGPFVTLPIHAAGVYTAKGECLADYAVSSYIPTLDTLLKPEPTSAANSAFKMVAVAQWKSPNQAPLPFTIAEIDRVKSHVDSQSLTVLGDMLGPEATVGTVLDHLETASFVHFACHGIQDLITPLDSALLLADGELKLSNVIKTPTPHASLAYLSACETAKGDNRVPDEALHMAATMLFAGFRGVVGTMWSIADRDAPVVADEFYRYIFRNGAPDPKDAAFALQLSVKSLREKNPGIAFERWVPFMHMGV